MERSGSAALANGASPYRRPPRRHDETILRPDDAYAPVGLDLRDPPVTLDVADSIEFSPPASSSLPSSPAANIHHVDFETGLTQSDKELNCDRRRPEEEDHSRLSNMSTTLMGKAIAPFLREHIPGTYAPVGKAPVAQPSDGTTPAKDPNSKYCYRHRPDSKCRRAADESKMVMIQSELDKLPSADRQAITHVWSLFSAAPSKHRELMLQGIVTQCCFPQLSIVSREVQDQLKIDFLTALPVELATKVLTNLDTVSLCKAAQVSRRWRQLADDDAVWHRMCEQHISRKCTKCGWGLPLLEKKRLRDWTRQQELAKSKQQAAKDEAQEAPVVHAPNTPRASTPIRRENSSDGAPSSKRRRIDENGGDVKVRESELSWRPFKDVYKERWAISSNWKKGRCAATIFKGHTNGVTCLQLDETYNILATGSYDATIKIWDLKTGKEIRTLHGHTRGIRTLRFDDTKLFSGSLDGTVRVFNWRTGQELSVVRHNDGVISVDFEGDTMVSGSIDKLIRVWNFKTNHAFSLRGHTDWVNQVRIDLASRTILSASDDCQVKLWDLDTKECLRTFEGHIGHVQQVLVLPPDFEPEEVPLTVPGHEAGDSASLPSSRSATPAVGANSSFITPDDPRPLYGPSFADPARPLPPAFIVTGGLDATVRLWSTATGRCLKTWFGHLEGIWALQGDALRVVTGANDGMVKVWDPRSGQCERTFTGHRGPVTCVGLSDSRMASGSEDGEVRLYSFQEADVPLEEYGTPS